MSQSNFKLTNMPYLTLWAAKFDEVVKLYKDTLGLPVVEENENFILFGTSGARIAFHRLGQVLPLERDTVELHFDVDDVDAAYEVLRAKGIKFHHVPVNKPWKQRQASFKDPEGYDVELVGPLKEGDPVEEY